MAIFKQDSINGEGEIVEGDVIRMPYRIAKSITNGGKTYEFVGMDKGEAVYRLQDTAQPVGAHKDASIKDPNAVQDGAPTVDLADLPSGAILHEGFVGRLLVRQGRSYRMMQPITKCNGQYVLLPV